MMRRLTAVLSSLLLLQLLLPGRGEMCVSRASADPAVAIGTEMHHPSRSTNVHGTSGSMTHPDVAADLDDTQPRSRTVAEYAGAGDESQPCHPPDAGGACATMPACASLTALPVGAARMDGSLLQLVVTQPAGSATPTSGAAPDTPPPRA